MTFPDREWHERMYNNRVLIPGYGKFLDQWTRDSEAARASEEACAIDLPYGSGPAEALDVFPAARTTGAHAMRDKAPVLVFIHGGFWRALDKSEHSFIAPAFTRKGVCVVVPNYALCPGTASHPVRIPSIALQMVQALAWTWRHIADFGGDPSRITVAGHSAGGHLAAMLLACDWPAVAPDLPARLVRSALSISGLYDLRPLRHVPFLHGSLHLTPPDARRASPALWPAPAAGPLYSVVGSDESQEFLRNNQLIRESWGAQAVPVCEELPGRHHFSVLDTLAEPTQPLHAYAMQLLRQP